MLENVLKKIIIASLCLFSIGLGTVYAADTAVVVNNSVINTKAIIDNGKSLVPVRAIVESLGANLDWNEQTRTITMKKDNDTVLLTIGEKKAYKNNSEISLDVPAKIINKTTYVPLRFVSESFDCSIIWDNTQCFADKNGDPSEPFNIAWINSKNLEKINGTFFGDLINLENINGEYYFNFKLYNNLQYEEGIKALDKVFGKKVFFEDNGICIGHFDNSKDMITFKLKADKNCDVLKFFGEPNNKSSLKEIYDIYINGNDKCNYCKEFNTPLEQGFINKNSKLYESTSHQGVFKMKLKDGVITNLNEEFFP